MAITNFIPTIWSETLYANLNQHHVGVANCNREFEGEIKEKGSVVKICGVGDITIRDYTKNSDMNSPQTLSDTAVELTVDHAKYFNFQIDDIDKAQCTPALMNAAMNVAAKGLANEADKYIYTLHDKANTALSNGDVTVDNILDMIIKGRKCLYENNVTDTDEVVIEVSPAIAEILLKAKVNLSSDNSEALEKGCIGKIAGCKVFVTNNIVTTTQSGTSVVFHKCFMRTKRAIAFVEQLSEIIAYKPEKRFADAVKGLYLFGADVVYDKEFVLLDLGINEG
ncbi:MAG: hypothetical protein E7641_05070 [Ruminococcaceae bacterium]|nr:hypothetical protein [Oscillospiraceae bacterium]